MSPQCDDFAACDVSSVRCTTDTLNKTFNIYGMIFFSFLTPHRTVVSSGLRVLEQNPSLILLLGFGLKRSSAIAPRDFYLLIFYNQPQIVAVNLKFIV